MVMWRMYRQIPQAETENVNIFNLHYERKMREELSHLRRKNINFCQKFKSKQKLWTEKMSFKQQRKNNYRWLCFCKRKRPNLWKERKERSFVSIAFVNNEAQVYDVVNITGFMYNVSPIEIAEKNQQQISLRKASLKDHTDKISINFPKVSCCNHFWS